MQGLQKALNRVENEIVGNPYETAVGLTKRGEVLYVRKGDKTSTTFISGRKFLHTVTHNHPGNCSFSLNDILAISTSNLPELRVATKDHVYSAKITKKISLDKETVKELVLDVDFCVRLDFVPLINNGTMTMEEANKKHWHEVWTRFTKKVNWFAYKRTKRQ